MLLPIRLISFIVCIPAFRLVSSLIYLDFVSNVEKNFYENNPIYQLPNPFYLY
jgi:hypothetical protein